MQCPSHGTEETPERVQVGEGLGRVQLCRAGPRVVMLNTNQQCALEAMKANHMPGCISKRAASSWRTLVIPLQLAFLRPHLLYCVMSSFEFPCKRHWQARLRPMEGLQDCGAGQSRMGWGNWVWPAWRRKGWGLEGGPDGNLQLLERVLQTRWSQTSLRGVQPKEKCQMVTRCCQGNSQQV